MTGLGPVTFASLLAALPLTATVEGVRPRGAPELLTGRETLERWYLSDGKRPGNPSGELMRALARVSSPGSLFVTGVAPGAEGRVRGFKLRPGRATTLRTVLENLGFAIRDFTSVAEGPCDRFETLALPPKSLRASPPVATEAALALTSRDDSLCRTDGAFEAQPLTALVQHGSSGSGLTLRLRNVDLMMLLKALRSFADVAFIVDGDVSGRFDVEWTNVTLEEALDSLRGLSGVYVRGAAGGASSTPAAPLRFRVSSTDRPWVAHPPAVSTTNAMAIEWHGPVAVFLEMVADYTGVAFVLPDGPLREASVLGTELDPGEVLANLLDSEGLLLSWQDPLHARLVRDPTRAIRAVPAQPLHPTEVGWRLRASDEDHARCRCLPVAKAAPDVELAGIGRSDGPWKAWYFAIEGIEPLGGNPRLPDDQRDYRVDLLDRDGVTLETKDGATLRLLLPPLPPAGAPQ